MDEPTDSPTPVQPPSPGAPVMLSPRAQKALHTVIAALIERPHPLYDPLSQSMEILDGQDWLTDPETETGQDLADTERTVRVWLTAQIGAAYERLAVAYPDDPAMAARGRGLEIARRIVDPIPAAPGAPRCWVCGCTDTDSCEGGCAWVPNPGMRDLCSACAPAGPCATSGCGSLGAYLDTSTVARWQWTRVRADGTGPQRWYCTTGCAAAALTADAIGRPGKVTPTGGGITQADAGPLVLAWDHGVDMPGLGRPDTEVRVSCTTPAGTPAVLVVDPEERLALASLLDCEVRDITRPCGTPGCGVEDQLLHAPGPAAGIPPQGFILVDVAGSTGPRRWYCSPPCVSDAIARAGAELADGDEAADLDGGL